jgi:hypothetical protein
MLADERAKLKEGVYPARGDEPEPAAGDSAALGDQDLNRDREGSCPRVVAPLRNNLKKPR